MGAEDRAKLEKGPLYGDVCRTLTLSGAIDLIGT
jgi:hypothetical protein